MRSIVFPAHFQDLEMFFQVFDQGRYYLVTASQKIGKSKITDYMFMYEPFFYMLQHRQTLRLKIFYFTLEMSKEEKYREFISHLLFRLSGGKIRLSPTQLRSTDSNKVLPEEVLALLQSDQYKAYFEAFEESVEFIDDIRNPTGVNKFCRSYALSHGKLHYKKKTIKDSDSGELVEVDAIDHYESDDPYEYRMILMDNASLLTLESGKTLLQTIDKMSKYFITLRNQLDFIPVLIQHQMQAQEGIENFKLDKLKPTADGLADCKSTIRDINLALGLYSPFRYGKREYEKYDITKFKDNIRFLEIIAGREGGAGVICPLYFDGAVSYFKELPLPENSVEIQKVYKILDEIRNVETSVSLNIVKNHRRSNKLFSKIKERIIKWQLL